ncbi:MAG: alpha/beta hydrolase [Chloroflexota bacterium]
MNIPKLKRAIEQVNGVKLFYRDTLSGNPTLFCLHGRWGRGETWTELIERYRERFRVVAPDQRGHGLSDKPIARYAGEDLARDAYELIERLGCGPVIAVGHSMGGRVASYLAALYPQAVRALAILDNGTEGHEELSKRPPQELEPVDELTKDWPTPYATYDEALSDLDGRFSSTGKRYFLDSLVESVEGYTYRFSPFAMAALSEYQQRWDSLLPRIQCPVWLVRARKSWCLSAEEAEHMRSLIPDCTYTEISHSDHMVYADNPEEFYPAFEAFLEQVMKEEQ